MPLYNPSNFSGNFSYSRTSTATTNEAILSASDTKEITDSPLTVDLELAEEPNRVGLSFWMPETQPLSPQAFWDSTNSSIVFMDADSFAYLYLGDAATVESAITDSALIGRWIKLTPGSYFEPLVCPTNAISIILFSSSTTNGSIIKVNEYVET